jgi:hypothetical protein
MSHDKHDLVLQASLGGLCLRCIAQGVARSEPDVVAELDELRKIATRNPALLANVWSYSTADMQQLLNAVIDLLTGPTAQSRTAKLTLKSK